MQFQLSLITEIDVRHVVDKKTKMYFMHAAGTYERNANENSRPYYHVFATDREIFSRANLQLDSHHCKSARPPLL